MIKQYEDGKLIIKILVIGIFVLFIAGYGIFQAEKIVKGPDISIISPTPGQEVNNNHIEIKGVAKNISAIWLNDRPIVTDEAGTFSEKLMVYSGYNIITLKAQDKFGANVEKKIEVVYKQ